MFMEFGLMLMMPDDRFRQWSRNEQRRWRSDFVERREKTFHVKRQVGDGVVVSDGNHRADLDAFLGGV